MHKQLKQNWTHPIIPEGYTFAAVILGRSGAVRLDYIKMADRVNDIKVEYTKMFSNHNKITPIIWPFQKGFLPNERDWLAIGFQVAKSFDNCFAHPDEASMFSHWIEKD
jgi:hypothetical protein